MVGVGLGVAGVAGAGGSILGSILGGSAQSDQAKNALDFVKAQAKNTKTWIRPFANSILGNLTTGDTTGSLQDIMGQLLGYGAAGRNPLTATLTKPFDFTINQLEQTPGYQFTLNQGLKGVQNSYAAQGLGTSGAAMKGATDYAENLASNTFQQNFADYLSQNQQIYNLLAGQQTAGLNAVLGQGTIAQQAASTAGPIYGSLGTANAMPWVAGGNAIGSAANSAASGYLVNQLLGQAGGIG